MAIDGIGQAREIRSRRTRVQVNFHAQRAEARPHRVVDGKEAPEIDVAFHRHRDLIQRDPEGGRERAIGDLLAGAECRQHKLDRGRPTVAAANAGRLVHRQHVVSEFDFRAEPLLELRLGTEGRAGFGRLVSEGVGGARNRLGHVNIHCGGSCDYH